MERKPGEQFIYKGVRLEVVEDKDDESYCDLCHFNEVGKWGCDPDVAGDCSNVDRSDGVSVYFRKVADEEGS